MTPRVTVSRVCSASSSSTGRAELPRPRPATAPPAAPAPAPPPRLSDKLERPERTVHRPQALGVLLSHAATLSTGRTLGFWADPGQAEGRPRKKGAEVRADTIRRFALSLPEAEERETWGTATFRVGSRIFTMFSEEERHAWVKSTFDEQRALVAMFPDTFFVPPYVGPRGSGGGGVFRVVAPDPAGFGPSDKPDVAYDRGMHLDDLDAIAEEFELDRPTV